MGSTAKTPVAAKFSVVVGLDFTDADGPAFDQAARLAAHVPGSQVHLLHVFETAPTAERSRDLAGHLGLYIDEKVAFTEELRSVVFGVHLRGGKVIRELIQLATEVQADVIVVGSHRGPHVKDWIIGSTVERLVGGAAFPVLVATPKATKLEAHEPVIEPPCPQCVDARFASGGKTWWCERHAHDAVLGHTYSYQREFSLSSHDSTVSSTGVDF